MTVVLYQLEPHTEDSVFIVVAYNFKCTYFGRIFHVLTYTEAFVVIADFLQSVRFRKLFPVNVFMSKRPIASS